jgi:hypothetical protein
MIIMESKETARKEVEDKYPQEHLGEEGEAVGKKSTSEARAGPILDSIAANRTNTAPIAGGRDLPLLLDHQAEASL